MLTGKSREIADMMTRRRIDICAYKRQDGQKVNLVVKQGILEMESSYTTVLGEVEWNRDIFKKRMAR